MSQFLIYHHILVLDLDLATFHTSFTYCYSPHLIPYYHVELFLLEMLGCATGVRDSVAYTRERNLRLLYASCTIFCPISCNSLKVILTM